MVFEVGGGLMLRIGEHDMVYPEQGRIVRSALEDNENVGAHIIQAGGRYDFFLVLLST